VRAEARSDTALDGSASGWASVSAGGGGTGSGSSSVCGVSVDGGSVPGGAGGGGGTVPVTVPSSGIGGSSPAMDPMAEPTKAPTPEATPPLTDRPITLWVASQPSHPQKVPPNSLHPPSSAQAGRASNIRAAAITASTARTVAARPGIRPAANR
jgi:hypothetical protein